MPFIDRISAFILLYIIICISNFIWILRHEISIHLTHDQKIFSINSRCSRVINYNLFFFNVINLCRNCLFFDVTFLYVPFVKIFLKNWFSNHFLTCNVYQFIALSQILWNKRESSRRKRKVFFLHWNVIYMINMEIYPFSY